MAVYPNKWVVEGFCYVYIYSLDVIYQGRRQLSRVGGANSQNLLIIHTHVHEGAVVAMVTSIG